MALCQDNPVYGIDCFDVSVHGPREDDDYQFVMSVKEKPNSAAKLCALFFKSFLVLIKIVVSISKSIYKWINNVKLSFSISNTILQD